MSITRRDDVWGGTATVAGSRVPVFMIVELSVEGETVDEIHVRYPHLTQSEISLALCYAHTHEGVIAQERTSYLEAVERCRADG